MEAVILEAVRTPIGRAHAEKGAFRDTHPNTLLQRCLEALVARTGIDPGEVEDVVAGCTAPFGEQSRNIARNAWLAAGYPVEVPAITIDRRCGSAQSAVAYAPALSRPARTTSSSRPASSTWTTSRSTRRTRSSSSTARPSRKSCSTATSSYRRASARS